MKKQRIIVLGSNSFIAKSVISKLSNKKYIFIKLTRQKINLAKNSSIKKLKKIHKNKDIVLFAAAVAPVKNNKMFLENLLICNNVCESLRDKKIKQMIYLSSDAVYSDTKKKIEENSDTQPENLHGLMHLTREIILKSKFLNVLSIIRPTLIYGKDDPHNGYGPNKFLRLIKLNKKIDLFGKGEEKRDHVSIDDVSLIISKIIDQKLKGIFNVASGSVISFREIAKHLVKVSKRKIKITYTKRKGQMPHGGYRAFNILKLKKNNLIKKPKLITNLKVSF